METLRKYIITLILLLISITASPQSIKSIVDLFSKSYEAENSKNYPIAIEKLKAGYDPDNYIINIRLGWLCYLAKQYTESINYYQKSIALRPYAIEARFGCVKPLSALEEWDKVKKQYIEILAIDPQNTIANYWLGLIYYNRKDFVNALKHFEKIVNLYPLDYDSVIMLAWAELYCNKPMEARILFGQALIIRPDDTSAQAGLKLLTK
jgi:tetratricopeptide (TPR) repeat protein